MTTARPAVASYRERLAARPGHRTAMTEHQHPLVIAGTSRIVTEKARNADFRRALYAP